MNTRTIVRIRKWLALVGILSVLSTLVVIAPIASAYSGADAPSWARDAVDDACDLELIDCSLANPNFTQVVNRSVGYQMLTSGFQVLSEDANSPFTDVNAQWYEAAAHTAYTLGWTSGSPAGSGNFAPSQNFTRAQMAVAVAAVLGLTPGTAANLSAYTDRASVPTWATGAVAALVNARLMGQGGNTTLRPNDGISKVETIVVLNASVNYSDDQEIDVIEVAAERLDTDVDTVQEALDTGMNVVGGELVAVSGTTTPPTGTTTPPTGTTTPPTGTTTPPTGTTTPPAPSGAVTVARAADTPAAMILASGTAFNPVLKFNLTAGSATAQVTGLKVLRGGLSSNANVAGVGVFDGSNVRHGNIGTSWNDDNTMDINFASEPISIAAGATVPVTLKVNLTAGAMAGTLTLALAATTSVTSNGTVSGTFPVLSNQMDLRDGSNTVATVTVDAVQVHNNGAADTTDVNVNLGTTRQQIATFRLANNNVEIVRLTSMTLYNNGSAADGDLTSIILVGPDGTDLQTVNTTTSKYVTFSGLNVELAKSVSTKDFKVYANIANGSTRTVRFLLQNDYDLVLSGLTSSAQLLPTLASVNDTAWPVGDRSGANFVNKITIAAGSLSFSRSPDSPTGNVAAGGTGLVLGRWEVRPTGEDMEVRQFSYAVVRSAATNLSGTLYFKIREGTSTTTTTLYSISGANADYVNDATAYTTTFVRLTAGRTYYLEAIGDIAPAAASGLTYAVSAVDVTQVKRISTNDIVDPGVAAANANTLTVRTGSLTVTANSGAAAAQVVAGQSTLTTLATFDFTAGSGEGISLTNIAVGTSAGNLGNIGASFKELEIWIDGAKKSQDTTSTISPASTATSVTFNISPSHTIAASQTAVVEIKGKVLTTATAGNVTLSVTASGVTGSGVTSQTALSAVPAAAVGAQSITINTAGTLTVSRDTVTNVKSSQIVAGSTNVVFGAYKLQTGNVEDVRVKKITVRNIGSNTNGVTSIGVYDGTTLLNDDPATSGNEGIVKASLGADASTLGNDPRSVTFDYSARPFVISKNSYKVLTVKANTVYSATNGNTVQFVIDSLELEGAGSSARIYPTLTTELASAASTNAYAVGEVVIATDGQAPYGVAAGTTTFASPVTTAVTAGGTMAGAQTVVAGAGVDLVNGTSTYRVTKLNPVYFGSSIISEVVSAAANTVATYSYAVGDVVAVNDNGTPANTNLHVITTAVTSGVSDLDDASDLVTGITLANPDRITRVAAGFAETTLAVAETVYNLGDILAVTDVSTPANNGLYAVTNAISVGGDMTAAAVVASQAVQLQSGVALVTGDYVAKMATLHTEVPSASAIYAYNLGDVVVIDDDSTAANNGAYVVRTAVAVGGSLLAADALGLGVTFTASDRISKLYAKSQEDNLKRLYPTKLSFAWVAPTSTVLTTGNQVEIGRFTLSADAANANNPGAFAAVTGLNFTELATATLTNFTLNDVTYNSSVATNANSSNFNSAASGGTMNTLTLQQGESRTFKVLADVQTNAGSQVAQLRFNSGSQYVAGSATWNVTGATTVTGITWTVLAGDAADLSSSTLTAATTGTDVAVPTISTLVAANVGVVDTIDANDTITVTFSEKIDPATVNAGLTYGGNVTAVGSTTTGGLTALTAAGTTTTLTVVNIGTMVISQTGGTNATALSPLTAASNLIVTDALNAAGTILTITVTTATGFGVATGTQVNGGGTGTSTQVGGTIKDTASNAMATNAALAKGSGTL